ncbi:4600_t:CDS:2 [Paraglomus brasilianum]|uniref:4600_t:CDS:1 n=1 Tax=Paraglomus brasilianum TaxID=144538 RepID=A0A9N9CB84_9GLOM|nr:4600_t:CDS:2 [Paraglomus brasilianum]
MTDKHITIGNERVKRKALERDIRLLIEGYVEKSSTDYATFNQVWTNLQFSLIHFVCPEKSGRELFMQCLYQITLSNYLETRLGVLFTLYLLYFTQPEAFFRVKIRLSPTMWQALYALYEYCKENELEDAAFVYKKLRTSQAFVFVAVADPCGEFGNIMTDIDPKKHAFHEFNSITEHIRAFSLDASDCHENLDKLEEISRKYYEKKHGVTDTPLAKRVAEEVSRQMTRSCEGPVDFAHVVSPLSASDEYLLNGLRSKLARLGENRESVLHRASEALKEELLTSNDNRTTTEMDDTTNTEEAQSDEEQRTSFDIRNNIRAQTFSDRAFISPAIRAMYRSTTNM